VDEIVGDPVDGPLVGANEGTKEIDVLFVEDGESEIWFVHGSNSYISQYILCLPYSSLPAGQDS